jgi:hypothetical protein
VPAILLRVLLAAPAALALAVGAHALRGDHRCAQVTAAARTAPGARLAAVGRDVVARCGDPRDRAVVALVLLNRGRRDLATGVARRMTATTPHDYVGWLALWRLTGDRRALEEARRLNPRGTPAR